MTDGEEARGLVAASRGSLALLLARPAACAAAAAAACRCSTPRGRCRRGRCARSRASAATWPSARFASATRNAGRTQAAATRTSRRRRRDVRQGRARRRVHRRPGSRRRRRARRRGLAVRGGPRYTGRARAGRLRRSFDVSDTLGALLGAGGSAALYGRHEAASLPNVDLGRLHGWGADVPVLVGYESDGDLYMSGSGARGGWEHVDIGDVDQRARERPRSGTPPIALSATRFWGGGLVGAAVGFRHVHVALELDASYATVTGDYNDTHARVAGRHARPAQRRSGGASERVGSRPDARWA